MITELSVKFAKTYEVIVVIKRIVHEYYGLDHMGTPGVVKVMNPI